jgi:hypothetical protein
MFHSIRECEQASCPPLQKLSLQRPILHTMGREILRKFFLHHGFVIGPVADLHLGDGVAFEGDDVSANELGLSL